jgi:methyl-accepting chemotaxis protein
MKPQSKQRLRKPKSIQAKFLSVILPAMAVLFFALGIMVHTMARRMQSRTINEMSLQLAASGSSEISTWLQSLVLELERVAEKSIYSNMDWNSIDTDLQAIKAKRGGDYGLIFLIQPDGSYYIPGRGKAAANLADRPYFAEVISKGKRYSIDDPSLSRSTNEKKFTVAVPITSNGKVVGSLAANVLLPTISRVASAINISGAGYGFIIDATGQYVAHPNEEYVLSENIANADSLGYKGLSAAGAQMLKNEKGISRCTNPDGNTDLIVYSQIPNSNGWSLAVSAPENVIFAQVDTFLKILVTYFLFTLAALAFIVWLLTLKMISRPLKQLIDITKNIAAGKLYSRISYSSDDEVGQATAALNSMSDKLKDIIKSIQEGASSIEQGGSQIKISAEQIASGANEQASASEEISSSMEEMVATINQNSDSAKHTEHLALDIARNINKVGEATNKSLSSINIITDKIKIIGEIAERTDLLAINAAIEAARAGASGKGFTVVASEVRKLAEKSQNSAVEIDSYSAQSVGATKEASDLMEGLMPNIQKNAGLMREIAAASSEQLAGAEQINKAIQELSSVTQQNSASSEELASSSEELANQAQMLKKSVSFFKLTEEEDSTDIESIQLQAKELFESISKIRLDKGVKTDELEASIAKQLKNIGGTDPVKKNTDYRKTANKAQSGVDILLEDSESGYEKF